MEKMVTDVIKKNGLINTGDTIIVGVSGGADSMALLHYFNKMMHMPEFNTKLYAVHINHMIRGGEAEQDARFVHHYCYGHHIPFELHYKNIPLFAAENGLTLEEAGRAARYEVLEQVRQRVGGDKIATAHTANDQSETLLMHLFRGAGLKGLGGMALMRGRLIRPLLLCTRADTQQYCSMHKIKYCMDSTNQVLDYTRNRIRKEVLPYIRTYFNPGIIRTISNTAEILKLDAELIEQMAVEKYNQALLHKSEHQCCLDIGKLRQTHASLLRRIFQYAYSAMNGSPDNLAFVHITALSELLYKQIGKKADLPGGIRARCDYGKLYLEKTPQNNQIGFAHDLTMGCFIYIPSIELYVSMDAMERHFEGYIKKHQAIIDAKGILNQLQVRSRRPGDVIAIKDGHKKLKNYWIDQKIPVNQRDEIPLVADAHNIIWIVGERLSAKYQNYDEKNMIYISFWGRENGV